MSGSSIDTLLAHKTPMGEGTMEIKYLDRDARRAATLPGVRPSGWTEAEVARLHLIVQCVRAGAVIEDVLSLRSLRLRANDLEGEGRYTTDLSASRLLALAFKVDSRPTTTAILDIVTRVDT
jgi:hypothetical protein